MEFDDDPEKRIRELERGLSDPTPVAAARDYQPGFTRPPGRPPVRWSWWFVVVGLVVLVPVVLAISGLSQVWKNIAGGNFGDGPVTVARGGTLTVGGNNENKTIACNEGSLTLSENNSTIRVVGHCASLTVSGYGNRVQADSIDTIAVNNYGNMFTLTGHCDSIKVSMYDNQLQVDSVDTVDISGYNDSVIYHSGSPKVTQSGYGITVKQG